MEVNGLPLHVLVVHAAVVFCPLAALAGLAYAARPGWRWLLRWPLLVLAAAAVFFSLLARLSGQAMLDDRPFLLQSDPLRERVLLHQDRGEVVVWFALAFLVASLLSAWSLGGRTALASGRGARETRTGLVGTSSMALLGVTAIALLVITVLAGDAGSQAVWGS
ncbi:DUF2231 domain-containing protein [Nocardioides sp. GCM10027113]|uniref:DUF2231 domain-containing protein n=1 Tax=unclassified Nocardioides TaxID=2615069 RepID=UPI00361E664F